MTAPLPTAPLPTASAPTAEERRIDSESEWAGSPLRTILVIDDSAVIRRVVQIVLGRHLGWRVITADSGAEGIELAARERPDAILLDVEMGGLDGPATLGCLRQQEVTREIPVLFLTGRDTEEDRRELAALGAAGLITKPFDPEGLAVEVGRLLGTQS